MVVLRAVHIGIGVFWVGSFLFMTFILSPRLKTLGPPVQGPAMGALVPVTIPVFITSASLVITSGAWMALKVQGGALDTFFTSSWGLSLTIGAVLTLIGFGLALSISMPAMREVVRIGASLKGQPPTPEQGMRMGYLAARIQRFGQMTAALLILAVGAMAIARYV
jgi:hypothetical protein